MDKKTNSVQESTRIAGHTIMLALVMSSQAQAVKHVTIGKIEDAINELIFDGWNDKRAENLSKMLLSVPRSNVTAIESPIPVILERTLRFSKMREFADQGKGDHNAIYDMIQTGHLRLMTLIRAHFKV